MKRKAKIYYTELDDFWRKEQKLEWLRENPLSKIKFEEIEPDAKHNWINQTDNDWDDLMPLIDKDVKAGKSEEAIFKLFSRGVATQRDEWVYDLSKDALEEKMRYFVDIYEATRKDEHFPDKMKIKWDRELSGYLGRNIRKQFEESQILVSNYRPYFKQFFYFDRHFNGMTYQWFDFYRKNYFLAFTVPGVGSPKDFHVLAIDKIIDLNALPAGGQTIPIHYFDKKNQKHENITDWALNRFREHYGKTTKAEARASARADESKDSALADAQASVYKNGSEITKQDIFYYVYGVLHCPQYRKKYEQNLKREFPRIPFYRDFFEWRDWGAELMDLHINYETREPFPLERNEKAETRTLVSVPLFADDNDKEEENTLTNVRVSAFVAKPRTKLRADKTQGIIEIDSVTQLSGVPAIAWEYKLGNRSAIEWILDQYKERKPKDATIAEQFNNYKFEDYKEKVIDLLKRVTNVSVKTMNIINKMPNI